MRRLTAEDGSIAIMVGLLLVVLVGIGSLVLDVGNLFWERRQLQNSADAAALAAAQDLTSGEDAATALATARTFADENNTRGAHVAPPGSPDPGFFVDTNSVTVTAQTGSVAAPGELQSFLASVIGVDTYATEATATASWGFIGGAATVPLTFSRCEWDFMTGGSVAGLPTDVRTVYFHSSQTAQSINTCGGPANQDHPGGFGWLDPQGGQCEAYVENGQVATDVGNNVPNECSAAYLQSLVGQTVIMPIFSSVTGGPGNNAIYVIDGFAALEVTGFRFSGNPAYNMPAGNPPCSGNDRCIAGRFVNYYTLDDVPTAGGVDFGAVFIGLTG
jgi:Flp pilus assembly protein TadG